MRMDRIVKDPQNFDFHFLIFETRQFINLPHCQHIE